MYTYTYPSTYTHTDDWTAIHKFTDENKMVHFLLTKSYCTNVLQIFQYCPHTHTHIHSALKQQQIPKIDKRKCEYQNPTKNGCSRAHEKLESFDNFSIWLLSLFFLYFSCSYIKNWSQLLYMCIFWKAFSDCIYCYNCRLGWHGKETFISLRRELRKRFIYSFFSQWIWCEYVSERERNKKRKNIWKRSRKKKKKKLPILGWAVILFK